MWKCGLEIYISECSLFKQEASITQSSWGHQTVQGNTYTSILYCFSRCIFRCLCSRSTCDGTWWVHGVQFAVAVKLRRTRYSWMSVSPRLEMEDPLEWRHDKKSKPKAVSTQRPKFNVVKLSLTWSTHIFQVWETLVPLRMVLKSTALSWDQNFRDLAQL